MKIKSFGCSFIYGSELDDDYPVYGNFRDQSKLTWPSLLAQTFDLEYECYAYPGQGNFKILCDLITQASLDDPAVMIINWTWIDRFDYVDNFEKWSTIRPSGNCSVANYYYRNLHSQLHDMLRSIYHINTAVDFLRERQMPFVMTYMDYDILTPIDPNWHDPRYCEIMQNKIARYLHDFDGKNFLDWSKSNGFAISDAGHPLEQAHQAAARHFADPVWTLLQEWTAKQTMPDPAALW